MWNLFENYIDLIIITICQPINFSVDLLYYRHIDQQDLKNELETKKTENGKIN